MASTSSSTTSARRSAASAARLDSSSRPPRSIRARRRSPAVSTSSILRSRHCQATAHRIARQPGLRAGQQALVREQPVDQRRLADVGPAGDHQAQRLIRHRPPARRPRAGAARAAARLDRRGEVGQPLAVLRRDRDRRAEAERPGLAREALARPAPRTCWRPGSPAGPGAAASSRSGGRARSGRPWHRSASARGRPPPAPRSVCWRSRPSRLSSGPSARPAVSIAVNASGPIRRLALDAVAGHARASDRPAPARRPTRRLNRVDLPTFGRPTMATVSGMAASPARRAVSGRPGAARPRSG